MSSSDFRQIAAKSDRGRSERLFRAAVSAFCSLTRPTRREIGQLEDLVMPLFDCASPETLRYVSAALSESDFAPENLVMRLADQPVEVAAPLLLRSAALTDVDLIALIGRHGISHARAIARRPALNPTISDLIRALLGSAARPAVDAAQTANTLPPIPHHHEDVMSAETDVETIAPIADNDPTEGAQRRKLFGRADAVRDRLRAMLAPASSPDSGTPALELAPRLSPPEVARLKDTALAGNGALFQTALADTLGIAYAQARSICAASSYTDLIFALRSLEIAEDTAFTIVAANHGGRFAHPEAIRIFLDRYRLCHAEAARDQVRMWKTESIATTVGRSQAKAIDTRTATMPADDTLARLLKAS